MAKKPLLITTGDAFEATGLGHRIWQPEGEGPFQTAVLVHGRLGNEDVMWIFARILPPDWQIISIRAIFAEGEGYSWHPPLGRFPILAEMDEAVTAVTHFIQTLPEIYNADPKKICLMGFSQGAATSFATAIQNPGLVQAIAGLVGFVPQVDSATLETAPLKNLPVFMAVGEKDDTIPLEIARQSGEQLRAAGAWLEYREYATGHKLNGPGMRKLQGWWETIAAIISDWRLKKTTNWNEGISGIEQFSVFGTNIEAYGANELVQRLEYSSLAHDKQWYKENAPLCIAEHDLQQLEMILENLKFELKIAVPSKGSVHRDLMFVLGNGVWLPEAPLLPQDEIQFPLLKF